MALRVLGQLPGTMTVAPQVWRINAPLTRFWRKSRQSDRHYSRMEECNAGVFGYQRKYDGTVRNVTQSCRATHSVSRT